MELYLMRKINFSVIVMLFFITGCTEQIQQYRQNTIGMLMEFNSSDPNQILLPDPFFIYEQNGLFLTHPYPGFSKMQLPANADYFKVPGCYIVCYSHYELSGVYSVSYNTYVNGLVRVAGYYQNRMCVPSGYANQDISHLNWFKNLCSEKLKSCAYNDCWAGTNTGGWLGIPPH